MIISGAIDITLALDPSGNGRTVAATFRDRNNEGEYGTLTIADPDFRPIEGLQLPFTIRATFNGQPYGAAVGDDRLDRDQCADRPVALRAEVRKKVIDDVRRGLGDRVPYVAPAPQSQTRAT